MFVLSAAKNGECMLTVGLWRSVVGKQCAKSWKSCVVAEGRADLFGKVLDCGVLGRVQVLSDGFPCRGRWHVRALFHGEPKASQAAMQCVILKFGH